jgi:hypothetical protein
VCSLIGEQYLREMTDSERLMPEDMTRSFMANLKRLDYAGNLKDGRAIGSGVVEGAAKTLGLRLKGDNLWFCPRSRLIGSGRRFCDRRVDASRIDYTPRPNR